MIELDIHAIGSLEEESQRGVLAMLVRDFARFLP